MASADQVPIPDSASAPGWLSRLFKIGGPIAVGVALLSALATFLFLSGLSPVAPSLSVVQSFLLVNIISSLILVIIIGREIWLLVQARRRGRAAARLHVSIVSLFSIVAAVPAILVAVVASITLDRGLDRIFLQQTTPLIQSSRIITSAYLNEHANIVVSDLNVLANNLAHAKSLFDQDRPRLHQLISAEATIRGLAAVWIMDKDRTIVERADVRGVAQIYTVPPTEILAKVTETDPLIVRLPNANYTAAVVKLRNYDNLYLYVARLIDPRVVAQLRATEEGVNQFQELQTQRLGLQLVFGLMYTVIALLLLLSAVWIGLNFANRLVAPIRRLIGAANIVSTGNLYVQVPIRKSEGDLAQLGETFNKMTQELRMQRDEVLSARDLIDKRRRFTEAVLASASAGVIGVDHDGNISILNRSAEKLIGHSEAEALGKPLLEIIPELQEIVTNAISGGQKLVQGQVTIGRAGRERNLSVRVTTEQSRDAEHGYVVTLDDITELVLAQRTSAWADVARRIAHEIKNPLTPIQLSAERLRRKYGNKITEDRAIFEQCTDTIIRQVDDIRRMVDEFSRFARMPKPVMVSEDVVDTVRQVVFLMRVGHADIDIDASLPDGPLPARFDRRLISQALTNIIKNATEGIAALPPGSEKGRILVSLQQVGGDIYIDVIDNGIGLPTENRSRLLEPYVTTRDKGTGLGLAIVGKILEDHGGGIELHDATEIDPQQRGAWIRLRFAAEPQASVENAAPETVKTTG